MKVITVTGTPGTGKTTIAKKLSKKLNFYYLDVSKLISRNKLYEGYDRKRGTKVVDVKNLNKFLINYIKQFKKNQYKNKNQNQIKGMIIDSHISHYLPRKYVDLCIITKCDIKELNKRLKNKKFNKSKVRENLQAEIFDVCYNEALGMEHKILVVNTTKGFNINRIVNQLG